MASLAKTRGKGDISINLNEGLDSPYTSSSRQNISVRIKMEVEGEKEAYIRRAGSNLQDTMNRYREKFESDLSQDTGMIMAMASLEVAYQYELIKEKQDYTDLLSRLEKMNTEIESIL